MAKATYPFFDMDVTKYMAQFKVPAMDVDALMASYRKNIEAVTAANQCALEGVGALVRRQAEIARESIESYTNAVSELLAEGSVEEKASRQAELARQSYDRAISNVRELGDMLARTGNEAFGLLNERVREGFGEMQDLVANSAARMASTAEQAAEAAERATRRATGAAEQVANATEQAAKGAASRK